MGLLFGWTMTVHAEPVEMMPGVLFDAEYYAKQNPDVTAVIGTEPDVLFQHYITYGQAEGRAPYEDPQAAAEAAALENAEQVVKLVNEERAKAGLSPLTLQSNMTAAANIRAKELEQQFSHTRPDGSSCFTALNEQGISNRFMGENIAYGQTTPSWVMNSWMNSSGHRANILNSHYTNIGVGCYQNENNGKYWVQLFTS